MSYRPHRTPDLITALVMTVTAAVMAVTLHLPLSQHQYRQPAPVLSQQLQPVLDLPRA